MSLHVLPRRAEKHLSLGALISGFLASRAIKRDRQRLALLDDHLLSDIGLSRREADHEANRKDWDVPDHWVR